MFTWVVGASTTDRHFAASHSPAFSPPPVAPAYTLEKITSAAAVTMADSSAAEQLRELNRVNNRTDMCPIVVVAGTIAFFGMLAAGFAVWVVGIALAVTIGLAIYAR
jgi:hypothetical protein